jgi:hypothetical protein
MRQLRNSRGADGSLFFFFKRTVRLSLAVIFLTAAVFQIFASDSFGGNSQDTVIVSGKKGPVSGKAGAGFKSQAYSHNQDMAFVSLMGNRPRGDFSGYRKAVLYNAKGAVIQEIDISRSDSIYSLDRMIQENRTKGPLIVRMIRK